MSFRRAVSSVAALVGAYSAAIDSYGSTTRYRQVLYTRTGLSDATHTIKVRVVGTSGRPAVGIDGVAFLR
jgi:hypothetical protein